MIDTLKNIVPKIPLMCSYQCKFQDVEPKLYYLIKSQMMSYLHYVM